MHRFGRTHTGRCPDFPFEDGALDDLVVHDLIIDLAE